MTHGEVLTAGGDRGDHRAQHDEESCLELHFFFGPILMLGMPFDHFMFVSSPSKLWDTSGLSYRSARSSGAG